MSEAETGMGEMPELKPIEDDGEAEDVVDEAEEGEPIDESDTPDDDAEVEPEAEA